MSETELAQRLRLSQADIVSLLSGHTRISKGVASKLEEIFGAPARFWLARDRQYREDLSRLNRTRTSLSDSWFQHLPIRDMVKFGWIRNVPDMVEELKSFFGHPDPEGCLIRYGNVLQTAMFRAKERPDATSAAVLAWLRQVERVSSEVSNKWDKKQFASLIPRLRELTRVKSTTILVREMRSLCAACGVAVEFVRPPAGCRVSGASFIAETGTAVIALTNRYLYEDHFWFSFFHEVGHLLLHAPDVVFVDTRESWGITLSRAESEANAFASETLIPASSVPGLGDLTKKRLSVVRFARKLGISPGVVVGQLQFRRLIGFNQLNSLKRKLEWADILDGQGRSEDSPP